MTPTGPGRATASASSPRAPRACEGCRDGGGTSSRVSLNRTLELLAGIAGRPLDVRCNGREHGDVRDTGADIALAGCDLGFSPSTRLEEGLAAEFAWVCRDERQARPRMARSARA